MAICLKSFQYIMLASLAISPRTIGKIVLQICGIKMLLPEINNPLCEIVQFKTIGWISEWYKCNGDLNHVNIYIWCFDHPNISIVLEFNLDHNYSKALKSVGNSASFDILKDNNHIYHVYIHFRNWRSLFNLFWTNITPTSSFL